MSEYQVLARKYRPKNFDQLLGQNHISQALSNAIDAQRLHHAYLFTGTRGVGKTTIARILAKCLNCETGITSRPCGVCSACQDIDAGRFLDLIEIDAASRTKVEDTRELLENVPYAPVQGRYKVYLIDEVHMLSTHSFNALLKTLEEPPEHVKFLFATTDPQKLPITIVSRCLQFVLRALPQELLVAHLQQILSLESIDYSDDALWQLASAAKGSVRDCLSLTDQAIAFGGGSIDRDTVGQMLGLVNDTDVLSLIEMIYLDNRQGVAHQIQTMREKMVDAASVMDRLIDAIHQMSLVQLLTDLPLDMNHDQRQHMLNLAGQIPGQVLQLYYEILIKSREGIRLASTPMQGLEMGILRLLAFRPLSPEMIRLDQPPKTPNPPAAAIDLDKADHPSMPQANEQAVEPESTDVIDVVQIPRPEPVDDLEAGCLKDDNISEESGLNLQTGDAQVDNQQADDKSVGFEITDQDDLITDSELAPNPGSDMASDLNDEANDDEQHQQDFEPKIAESSIQTDNALTLDLGNDGLVVPVQNLDELADMADDMSVQNADNESLPLNQMVDQSLQDQPRQEQVNHGILPVTHESTPEASELPTAEQSKLIASDTILINTKKQMAEFLQPPVCQLPGEWTPEKWDYWLSLARLEKIFDVDELALMADSVMVGQIEGKSTLYVPQSNLQVDVSFANLHAKMADYYPKIELDLQYLVAKDSIDSPTSRRIAREEQAVLGVKNQLIASPVFQKLWHDGYLDNDEGQTFKNFRLFSDDV